MSKAFNWMSAAALACATLTTASLAHADEAGCARLATATIPAAAIALPTGGGKVTAATYVPAGQNPGFCRVVGQLAPVDPSAPPVLFQVNLPDNWNRKAVQFGGGGLNGTLVTGEGRLRDQPPVGPSPLQKGYATFGTDSGHPVTRPDIATFFRNAEAFENFAYASYKKTRDTAGYLIQAYFGAKPERVYYFGGSEGGREGMVAVQKFPQDYDGVVSAVPVIGWTGLMIADYRDWKHQVAGGWMEPGKLELLRKASMATCDSGDGAADGVISNYLGCDATRIDFATIRCADGAEGQGCLSDAQIALARSVHAPAPFGFALANGADHYPGKFAGGEVQAGGMVPWRLGEARPAAGDMGYPHYGTMVISNLIVGDPAFRGDFDPARYREKLRAVSEMMDFTNPDIRAFQARGGKLIIKQNGSDYAQSPMRTFQYYRSVVDLMGQAEVDKFVRLYVTPGVNHGGSGVMADGSPIPDKVDLLDTLDAWVVGGNAPGTLVSTAYVDNRPTGTRPLCQYPAYPRYKGTGDVKDAASFACVR